MYIFLNSLAMILAILSIHVPYWNTFLPWLGTWPSYYDRPLRFIMSFLSLMCGVIACWLWFSVDGVIMLVVIIVLNSLTILLQFPRVFVVLHNPEHRMPAGTHLSPEAMIFGYVNNDLAVAWPIDDMLVPRHLIHDQVGKQAVVVSYCAACRSALLFSSILNGQALHFEVAGVWRRNLLMRDSETRTLWQQATGEAIHGKLKGQQLKILPGKMMTWQAWQQQYPQTTLAVAPINTKKPFLPITFLTFLLQRIPQLYYAPGFTNLKHNAIKPHDTVVGIIIHQQSKAYSLKQLKKSLTITDTFADHIIKLHYDPKSDSVTAYDNGKEIPVDRQWWLGWKEFHPDTSVYS